MSRRRARPAVLAAPLLVVALVAACSGDDGGAAPTLPPTSVSATTEPATTEPDATEPSTTEPATTEPATTEPDATEPDADGFEFVSDDAIVSVVFPAEPTESELPVELPDGEILSSPLFIVETDDGAYFLSWTDFGSEVDPAGASAVLDDARDGALGNIGADMVSSTPVDVDGRVGLDFSGIAPLDAATEALYQSVVSIDGSRLYQVTAVSLLGTDAERVGREFLDSFAFIGEAS